jgi:hypothetical protein
MHRTATETGPLPGLVSRKTQETQGSLRAISLEFTGSTRPPEAGRASVTPVNDVHLQRES